MPGLCFEQRGTTWTVTHDPVSEFPILLIARRVYYGKDRVLTTLTLAKVTDPDRLGSSVKVMTEHVDMLIGSRRKGFVTECARRLKQIDDVSEDSYSRAIASMLEGLLEKLLEHQNEIEMIAADEIEIPADLTPPYALWPLVPCSRPGMLVAPSGSGKSGLALLGALSCVLGRAIIPRIEPRSTGPVLYVGQEETKEQWAARLEMVCRGLRVPRPKGLYYVRLVGASLLESAELLGEKAASAKAVLVVIDSAQATWGDEGDSGIRGYASRWYNAVIEQVKVPTLIVEHPNAANTGAHKNGKELFAAGTSVKRDRVGHVWSLRSVQLPTADGDPIRYHVTLTDEKRNYVARQPNITYQTVVKGYEWMQFESSGELTPDTIVEVASSIDGRIAKILRAPDAEHEGFGYNVTELKELLKQKDDRRLRTSLSSTVWRPGDWEPGVKFRFAKIPGSGSSHITNPVRYTIETRMGDPVEEPSQMGLMDDDEWQEIA